jgi:hypothetical protein
MRVKGSAFLTSLTTICAICSPPPASNRGWIFRPFRRWLGHKDGGALAMKVYGHLRDQHSVNMAQRVSFDETSPSNVVDMIPEKALDMSEGGIPRRIKFLIMKLRLGGRKSHAHIRWVS